MLRLCSVLFQLLISLSIECLKIAKQNGPLTKLNSGFLTKIGGTQFASDGQIRNALKINFLKTELAQQHTTRADSYHGKARKALFEQLLP